MLGRKLFRLVSRTINLPVITHPLPPRIDPDIRLEKAQVVTIRALTSQDYFGLTATRFGGAAVLSDFLKGVANCRVTLLLENSIRTTVLLPATPNHAVFPSGSMPPLKGSVAPAGKVILTGVGVLERSETSTLLIPAGSTIAREAFDATTSCRAVKAPRPKFTDKLL